MRTLALSGYQQEVSSAFPKVHGHYGSLPFPSGLSPLKSHLSTLAQKASFSSCVRSTPCHYTHPQPFKMTPMASQPLSCNLQIPFKFYHLAKLLQQKDHPSRLPLSSFPQTGLNFMMLTRKASPCTEITVCKAEVDTMR